MAKSWFIPVHPWWSKPLLHRQCFQTPWRWGDLSVWPAWRGDPIELGIWDYTPEDSHGTCLAGGFKYFFWIFTPKIGEDSQSDEYFSDGLKPPTRCPHGGGWFRSCSFLFMGFVAVGEPAVHLPGCIKDSIWNWDGSPINQASSLPRILLLNESMDEIQTSNDPGCYPRQNPIPNVLMCLCFWTRCHVWKRN